MTRAVRPTMKRLAAMQATRTSSAATAATATAPTATTALAGRSSGKMVSRNNNNNTTSRVKLPLQLYESLESSSQHCHQSNNKNVNYESSFESSLNQVLRLERDSQTTANSHHSSMETCVRDFFRV